MPTYISLINWTDQGVRNYADTVQRATEATEAAQRMGGQLPHVYWTVGPYDLVVVASFADDETATAFLLALGSRGNIRTTTLRAYEADDMTRILQKLQ
jgi:uncharacterized protein with GYD domain